jgi:hypothetical protein
MSSLFPPLITENLSSSRKRISLSMITSKLYAAYSLSISFRTFHFPEREEAKRRILEENPNIAKDALEFMLSLPVEQKIPKVTKRETIHATPEQQEEMEKRLMKENNKK